MKHYVGLDVSMKETYICIQDKTGETIHQGRVETDPYLISEYLKKFQLDVERVGLEKREKLRFLQKKMRIQNG